jgi:hypothetical protein
MKLRLAFLFVCLALGTLLTAATPAFAGACGPNPCQQLPPDCGYDNYCTGTGGSGCAPDDRCCSCQAPCRDTYNQDVKSCTLTGPAQTDCLAIALNKMNECLILCTADGQCA